MENTSMKKTYINPQLEIVKLSAVQLLAGSDPKLGGEYGGGDVLGREDDFNFE